MKIKRYEAETMKEGLEQVKSDLGEEALILSAKNIQPAGGLSGSRKSLVEIIAAHDRPENRVVDSKRDGALDAISALDPIREDIRDLKDAVSRFAFPRVSLPPVFDRICQEMVFQGVQNDLAIRLTLNALQDLGGGANGRFPERSAVIERVARQFPPSGPIRLQVNGKPEVVVLVGPTGMGKTTTLAKLAAYYTIQARRRVAMMTIDSYRIGAAEQLKIYGKIMGLPVDVVERSRDLREALRRRQNVDLILIDTAGRSHRDRFRLQELRGFFDGFAATKHLVLSCHTKERDLEEIVSRFSSLGLDRLLFTKLDEATTFGTMVNIGFLTNLPISYLTIGQKVPEDIREATPELLSDLIFSMGPVKKLEGGSTLKSARD